MNSLPIVIEKIKIKMLMALLAKISAYHSQWKRCSDP
jgi:hypothetical protein